MSIQSVPKFLCILYVVCSWPLWAAQIGYLDLKDEHENKPLNTFFRIPPSVRTWDTVATPRRFAVTSMTVDHHSHSPWYMSALHEKYSIGWNRTILLQFTNKPLSCTVRFFGVALESVLEGFQTGGTGYLTLGFKAENKKHFWVGFDKNETVRLHCYYRTNKDQGSEFLDTPKTLGLAIMCPVTLDQDIGEFLNHRHMETGRFCRPLAEVHTEASLHLRPSAFEYKSDQTLEDAAKDVLGAEIAASIFTNPSATRQMQVKAMMAVDPRPHAVCTVQTFRNVQTGSMLYMFIAYYQKMGWRVIVYDRFGMHYQDVKSLLALPGVDYYPFTLYQLAQPSKYNQDWLRTKQGKDYKTFYKMETNWGYSSKTIADTADQDADKARTYDYARVEYAHLDMLLYIDADELFFCPQPHATRSLDDQVQFQHRLMSAFHSKGIQEMRFVRIPYSGFAPDTYVHSAKNEAQVDFTNHSGECMNTALAAKSLLGMAKCWSSRTAYDNFPKSADFASVCPFHYNHWSCDGMKGGGRDWTKVRCRCKVGFDMQNFFVYQPVLRKCHLMHFNDNKYRFQSNRMKHKFSHGNVSNHNVLTKFLEKNLK